MSTLPPQRPRRRSEPVESSLVIRNVVVAGHRTSVRLEPMMWEALTEIAHQQDRTVHEIVTEIDRRRIHLPEPIKETGDYSVQVRLHRDVTVDVPVTVTGEGGAQTSAHSGAEGAAEAGEAAPEAGPHEAGAGVPSS